MRDKQIILVFLLMILLAACTTSGSETAETPPAISLTAVPEPTGATSLQVNHNGLTFTYDPALLGSVNIQDVPATANDTEFGQPGPAHTWVGFVPTSVNQEMSHHWRLAWEPHLTIYSLNDFGSFATGDQYARERVALFRELVAERSSTITAPIPVIPPINAGQIIRAQVKWLDFGSGVGVRFLTQYDQAASPINNEGLVYIFQGITDDGRQGVTAVFPVDAAGLPDGPAMNEAEYTAFITNLDAELAAVTESLNAAPDGHFNPPLSQLDALVMSISIIPAEGDFPVIAGEPQYGQVTADTEIVTAPGGAAVLGRLPAGNTVILNGVSEDGRYRRILCPNGATGSCWVASNTVTAAENEPGPVFYTGGLPAEGDITGITAVSTNIIYNGPGESYTAVGKLLASESASVLGPDETGQWWAIECPDGFALACWVVSDTAVNQPTSFVADDGWQDVSDEFVTFRVPDAWQPTAVPPGMGSVLAEWRLGIPGLDSDQNLAFLVVPFAGLMPDDVDQAQEVLIGGEPGVKWIRRGEGYVSYDYYTAGTAGTQAAGAGSFGLHVTLPAGDPDMEYILDTVAAFISFNR